MNKKTSDILKGMALGAIILVAFVCIAYFTITQSPSATATPPTPTTKATTATATTTPTPTATPTPVEGKPKSIPQPTDDAISVDKTWSEAAMDLWGVGDIAEKKFSHMSSRPYKDKYGTYFALNQFRVYTYTGAAWEQTELYPMFGDRIVIDKGRRQIVLGESTIEVWEQDYRQESFWNVERLFAVSVDEPDSVRIFGDWYSEDENSIAYIASESANLIWAISESGISCMWYGDVLFSNDYIFVIDREEAKLIRIAYRTERTEEDVLVSLNEEILPTVEEENAIFMVGDTSIDPISFTGHLEEADGNIIFSDPNGVKVIVD